MAIPAWALGVGALMKTPEVASDWMGLFDKVNAIRDEGNANTALEQLRKLSTTGEAESYQPSGYLRPDTRLKLEKLRAERLDALRNQEAAPFQAAAARLNRDPEFRNDPEALQEFARRPEFWLDAPNSGVIQGAKRGAMPATATGANPRIAEVLQSFGGGNQNVLDAFRASSGDRMAAAHIAGNKDLASSFKDASAGVENYEKLSQADRLTEARSRAGQFIADYPLERNVESWNGLVEGLRTIPDLPQAEVNAILQDMAARNTSPVGTLNQRVSNGPNSTTSEVEMDMFGRPVSNTRITSTNNPSDRELGLTGGEGDGGVLDVSWVGPDGKTAQSARIPRNELPALKAQLQAQGVKTIDTVDGKRPSKRETLIKPVGKAKGIAAYAPTGGAPVAPATSGGGYVYSGGKLVKQ